MAYEPRKSKSKEPVTVTPGALPTVVPNPNIQNDAVDSRTVKDRSIQSEDIAPQAVDTPSIQDGAVTQYKIGLGAVKNEHLADVAVGRGKIADGAVGTNAIANYAVTTPKIAPGAVTQDKLGADVGANILGVDSVLTVHIKDSNVTAIKLAPNAVTSAKISAGAVGNSELAANAVTNEKILDGTIAGSKLAPGFGLFTIRRVSATDFDSVDFTWDGNLHADGLDLSAIVPANAIGVLLGIYASTGGSPASLIIGTNQTDALYNTIKAALIAGLSNKVIFAVVPLDPDLLLDYTATGTFSALSVVVLGWII